MFRIRTYLTNACLACFDLTVATLCLIAVWQWETDRGFRHDRSAEFA